MINDTARRCGSRNGATRQRQGRHLLERHRKRDEQTWTGPHPTFISRSPPRSDVFLRTDPGHFFRKETQKVVLVPSLCRGGRRSLGTVVSSLSLTSFDLDLTMPSVGSSMQNYDNLNQIEVHSLVYLPVSFPLTLHRPSRIQRYPCYHPHQSPSGHAHLYLVRKGSYSCSPHHQRHWDLTVSNSDHCQSGRSRDRVTSTLAFRSGLFLII